MIEERDEAAAFLKDLEQAHIDAGPYGVMLVYLTGEGRHHAALLHRAMSIVRADRPLKNRLRELATVFVRVLNEHVRSL